VSDHTLTAAYQLDGPQLSTTEDSDTIDLMDESEAAEPSRPRDL
jgi:hypothetical protein